MMKLTSILLIALTLNSCVGDIADVHLDEKVFKNGDITVKWFSRSLITSSHDFVEVERWGWTKEILKANPGGIYDIIIEADTITILATTNILVYDLAAITLDCHIKLDPSISTCQYMKKHAPENAKYHCDSISVDSSGTVQITHQE